MRGPFLLAGWRLLGYYGVDEGAQAFDGDGDGFAGLEPALGGAACAYSGGSAGGDDIAGEQWRDGGDIFDQRGDLEDQFAGIRVLQNFAVDGEADGERVRVGDFIG